MAHGNLLNKKRYGGENFRSALHSSELLRAKLLQAKLLQLLLHKR